MNKTYDFLNHIEIFSKEGSIKDVEKLADDKLKITTSDGLAYALSLYDIDRHVDISSENYIQERLRDIGLDSLKIYEEGILPDIKKCYKVFSYRDELSLRDFLTSASRDEAYKLGHDFGEILKKLHQTRSHDSIDWEKDFLTKTNYLFYMHGLSDKKRDKDYIIIDHIRDNIHLTKSTPINLLYGNISDKNIRVYGDSNLDLRGIKEIKLGDGIFDFVDINRIAIDFPDFAKGTLEGYLDDEKPGRKFFRLLSLYQAYVILYSNILGSNTEFYLDQAQRDSINKMYDNFNEIVPSWAK